MIDGGHMVAMSNPAELANRLELTASQFTVVALLPDGEARGRGSACASDSDNGSTSRVECFPARIVAKAGPGEGLVSRATRDLAEGGAGI